MTSPNQPDVLQPLHPSMEGKLDPAFEKLYYDNMANLPARPPDLNLMRANYASLYTYCTVAGPEVGRVYEDTITASDGTAIPVRVYEPADSRGPWPAHVDFHGGGWGLGDLETEAHICRHICKEAGVVVIDVAYRLVPEHPFPKGLMDSFDALKQIHATGAERFQIRTDSLSVGGVSAGGFIALAIAHLARDMSPSIPLQLVTAGTPVIDDASQYSSIAESPHSSMRENEFAPTLNWMRLTWFEKLKWSFLPSDEEARRTAREQIGWFSNLFKAPRFDGLPRTVIYTAGADPLRDEGEKYGQILVENGVEVVLRRFLGVPHPFMHMDKDLWQGREFIASTAREIRRVHWLSEGR